MGEESRGRSKVARKQYQHNKDGVNFVQTRRRAPVSSFRESAEYRIPRFQPIREHQPPSPSTVVQILPSPDFRRSPTRFQLIDGILSMTKAASERFSLTILCRLATVVEF